MTNEKVKEIYGKIVGKVQLCKDNVQMANVKLKEEMAALRKVQDILDMIERDYREDCR